MARTGGDGGRKSPRTADAEDPDVHERLGDERFDATEAAAIEPRRHLVLARRGRRPFKSFSCECVKMPKGRAGH